MDALTFVALLALAPAPALPEEQVFRSASDLRPWCEDQARAAYVGRGMTTYQWTASHFDRGNVLHVEGKLRADGQDVSVRCRVARGARERYASIEIDDARLK